MSEFFGYLIIAFLTFCFWWAFTGIDPLFNKPRWVQKLEKWCDDPLGLRGKR